MNKITLHIALLYILISPFYVFRNGLPQPADFVLIVGICLYVIVIKKFRIDLYRLKNIIVIFIINIIFVNAINYITHNISYNGKITDLIPIAYYIYNILVFLFFIHVLKNNNKSVEYITKIIIITILIQFIIANTITDVAGIRRSNYFNKPNQLGYYATITMTMFIILNKYYNQNIISKLIITISTLYLTLISGSRAAIVGIVLLGIILLAKEIMKNKLVAILLTVVILLFINVQYTEYFNSVIDRQIEKENTFYDELLVRGYDRLWTYPEYLLIGSGEMYLNRFSKSYHQLEIHSAFGTMLFSYGIIGLLSFTLLIYYIIKRKIYYNIIVLMPVIIYNMTHQGIRFTHFWVLMAIVYYISTYKTVNKK